MLSACAQASAPQTGQPAAPQSTQAVNRTLVAVVRVEPVSLAARPLTATGAGVSFTTRVFNAGLDLVDDRDEAQPYLAEALPQLNTDTWRVLPDGKMETTYHLKPNVTWQDGKPLVAQDFAFAYRVYSQYGESGTRPLNAMEGVAAPDDRTVVIQWKQPFPDAASLSDSFQALPRHILAESFDSDPPETFINLPYWSSEYIGAGPYKLDHWEPGTYVEASAFAGHVLGKPKIEKLRIRFMADENTVLTNLLTENVHLAGDRSIRFEHTQVMNRQWSGDQRGKVLLGLSLVRYILPQFRPELANPAAMTDVRVRRAIMSSIDKQAMSDGVFDGQAVLTDTFVSPDLPFFSDINAAIAKYPFDPRRSEQLMGEAGFTKDRDGFYASASGERFSPLFWEETGVQNEKELGIIVDTWRRAGFDMQTWVLPAAQFRDGQLRASFPAMYTTQGGGSTIPRLEFMTTTTIPSAANRWGGNNRGGWSNAEYDRLWGQVNQTLDTTERNRQVVEMLRILSEEVPAMPIYFNFAPTAYLSSLTGPTLRARIPDPVISWNIHEWTWVN
jgi:peptide/nickel transport system substrate-binding protein